MIIYYLIRLLRLKTHQPLSPFSMSSTNAERADVVHASRAASPTRSDPG